jgi:outer membrane immunogenic protein
MKKIFAASFAAAAFALFSAPALGADRPVPYKAAPMAAAAPVFNWTGFYIGGQGGYAWGDSVQCFQCGEPTGGATDPYHIRGGFGGATAGYNWQFNPNWIVGIETDFSFSGIKGIGHDSPTYGCGECFTKVDWFGTVRGRLGYAVGNTLFYGTGGWAYGHLKASFTSCLPTPDCHGTRHDGWTAGGGIEWAFAPAWSAKLEYLHVDLGRRVFSDTGNCAVVVSCSVDAKFDLVRVGLNYRFGSDPWGKAPVVAKY